MFYVSDHGGFCCGIKHISDIPVYSKMAENILKERINKIQDEERWQNDQKNTILIEMVFTDNKLNSKKGAWRDALNRLGFINVFRNKNPNSPNYINIFIWNGYPENVSV